MTKDKLSAQDVVLIRRTKTLAVVNEVAEPNIENRKNGKGCEYSLLLPLQSRQRAAWYDRDELQYLDSVKNLVAKVQRHDQIAKANRNAQLEAILNRKD